MTTPAESAADVFGRAAGTYDQVIGFFAHFGDLLVGRADIRPGDVVLDLGCGRGAAIWPALKKVGPEGHVLGADLSAEMVDLVQDAIVTGALANAAVRRLDAQGLDLPDESFDAVLSNFVLQLLPEPERAAEEIHRVLRPGGQCAASIPTGSGTEWSFLGDLFGSYAGAATAPVPLPFRPSFDVAGLLSAAGLSVVGSTEEVGTFWFADEDAWWRWAWSQGMRSVLELLPPDTLERFRAEAFGKLAELRTAQGIRLRQEAVMVIATRLDGAAKHSGMASTLTTAE